MNFFFFTRDIIKYYTHITNKNYYYQLFLISRINYMTEI